MLQIFVELLLQHKNHSSRPDIVWKNCENGRLMPRRLIPRSPIPCRPLRRRPIPHYPEKSTKGYTPQFIPSLMSDFDILVRSSE